MHATCCLVQHNPSGFASLEGVRPATRLSLLRSPRCWPAAHACMRLQSPRRATARTGAARQLPCALFQSGLSVSQRATALGPH